VPEPGGFDEQRPSHRDPDVLTLTQAAALVGVSDERLKDEVASGRLAGRRIGRTWRFSRNALMAWLEERPADV
jgi:excisionase family DNA binding protein